MKKNTTPKEMRFLKKIQCVLSKRRGVPIKQLVSTIQKAGLAGCCTLLNILWPHVGVVITMWKLMTSGQEKMDSNSANFNLNNQLN